MSAIKKVKLIGTGKPPEKGDWRVRNTITGEIIVHDRIESEAKGIAHGHNHHHYFGSKNLQEAFVAELQP